MQQVFTLKNGLKVATYSIPSLRSFFLSLSIRGGSIFDTKETQGTAHFMEHILCEGIPSLPTNSQFIDFIEGIGGYFNASTNPEIINFTVDAPAVYLDNCLKIASEVFFEPLFPPESIERERKSILVEIAGKEEEYHRWFNFARKRFLDGHPLRLSPTGLPEVISHLSRDNLINYWSRFFFPNNAYLVIVGKLENDQIKSQVENVFQKYVSEKNFPGYPKLPRGNFSDKGSYINTNQSKIVKLMLSFPSIPYDNPLKERVPQYIIRNILGSRRNSRLNKLLRHGEGLVYSAHFEIYQYQHFGYISINCECAPANIEEVAKFIIDTLSDFKKFGPTVDEIEFSKRYHINRCIMDYDHPSSIARILNDDLLRSNRVFSLKEYTELVKTVDQQTIKTFIEKYWDLSKTILYLQGPLQDSFDNRVIFTNLLAKLG